MGPLEDAALIAESDGRPDPDLEDERRRYYRLTASGRAVLVAETATSCDGAARTQGVGPRQPVGPRRCVIRGWLRVLLLLLPAHVRDEHEQKIAQLVRLSGTDVATSSGVTTRLWLTVLLDAMRAGPRAHWDVLRQNCGFTARQLRRSPGMAAAAIVTLAIGIGGNATLFSRVD